MMKIRSAVLRSSGVTKPYAKSKPIHIEEIELDAPQEGEVLIQIKAASLFPIERYTALFAYDEIR